MTRVFLVVKNQQNVGDTVLGAFFDEDKAKAFSESESSELAKNKRVTFTTIQIKPIEVN